jgi:hypothetical protein
MGNADTRGTDMNWQALIPGIAAVLIAAAGWMRAETAIARLKAHANSAQQHENTKAGTQ